MLLGLSGADSVPGQQQGAVGNQRIWGDSLPIQSLAGQQTCGLEFGMAVHPLSPGSSPLTPGPTQGFWWQMITLFLQTSLLSSLGPCP